MNVVDSSAWIEFFVDGTAADALRPAIEQRDALVVPTITLLEVARFFRRTRDEILALKTTGFMGRARVVDLDRELALDAARLGLEHGLPLADSVIYATARRFDATLWTQDRDFKGLPGVELVPREPAP